MTPPGAGNDPTTRLRSVLALPEDASAAPALLAAVEDVSLDVARTALRRLVRVAGRAEVARLRDRLLELDIGIVGDVAAALRKLDDTAGAAAVCCAGLGAEGPARRHKAAIALRELRAPAARAHLLRALADRTAPVRRASVEALERLPPDAASVTAVRRRLADPDVSVRAAAVGAVARLDAEAARTLAALPADGARAVREALARAACRLRRETVVALLDDAAAEVRVEALRAVAKCAASVPVSCLVARAGDQSWHVRRAACDALASAAGEESARALLRLLVDPRLEVRGRAVVALERLHGGQLDEALERSLPGADAELRRSLIDLLGRRGRGQLALRYVEDPVSDVRIAVAHAMAGEGSSEAGAALRALAGDDDPAVRNAARTVLDRS